ncbi:hypothetical protein G7Z17_g10167 [Cylindrodendrum hubeiense]|uniref:Uncharacterized protein n=1 Tax=Cylindrodendrum hubeiense TaxID=595255 RepID=A0A9P5L7H2_9HYPO|nr:hypothetical protein G7Z17_g10167 [Cylindrodendrum hubeiense]
MKQLPDFEVICHAKDDLRLEVDPCLEGLHRALPDISRLAISSSDKPALGPIDSDADVPGHPPALATPALANLTLFQGLNTDYGVIHRVMASSLSIRDTLKNLPCFSGIRDTEVVLAHLDNSITQIGHLARDPNCLLAKWNYVAWQDSESYQMEQRIRDERPHSLELTKDQDPMKHASDHERYWHFTYPCRPFDLLREDPRTKMTQQSSTEVVLLIFDTNIDGVTHAKVFFDVPRYHMIMKLEFNKWTAQERKEKRSYNLRPIVSSTDPEQKAPPTTRARFISHLEARIEREPENARHDIKLTIRSTLAELVIEDEMAWLVALNRALDDVERSLDSDKTLRSFLRTWRGTFGTSRNRLINQPFFFIPLALVAGIFGMNINEFETKLAYWHWILASITATTLTYTILYRGEIVRFLFGIPKAIKSLNLSKISSLFLLILTYITRVTYNIPRAFNISIRNNMRRSHVRRVAPAFVPFIVFILWILGDLAITGVGVWKIMTSSLSLGAKAQSNAVPQGCKLPPRSPPVSGAQHQASVIRHLVEEMREMADAQARTPAAEASRRIRVCLTPRRAALRCAAESRGPEISSTADGRRQDNTAQRSTAQRAGEREKRQTGGFPARPVFRQSPDARLVTPPPVSSTSNASPSITVAPSAVCDPTQGPAPAAAPSAAAG